MLLALYWFEDSELGIMTITFSALILAELLNIYSEVRNACASLCAHGDIAYEASLDDDSLTDRDLRHVHHQHLLPKGLHQRLDDHMGFHLQGRRPYTAELGALASGKVLDGEI